MSREFEINTICPICKIEITEDDEIIMGNKDDLNIFDPFSTDKFEIIHLACLKENAKDEFIPMLE